MTELMLKLAAFLAMVIDHAAACRLDRVFFPAFSKVYVISRAIGRMAFPIYTFCLVEGFRHSHDLRRYGGRLLLLGVISQLPYAFTLNRWYLEPAFGEVFPADPSRAFRNCRLSRVNAQKSKNIFYEARMRAISSRKSCSEHR